MSLRIVNHCWLHEHQAAVTLSKDQTKMRAFLMFWVLFFHYKKLGKWPPSTKVKIISSQNSRMSPLGKVGTKVKILPVSNRFFLCKNNKTSNSTKPDIKFTYFNESKLSFFFPVQSTHSIWKYISVFHTLGMHSGILGNYTVMFSAVSFRCSSQLFCGTLSLA